MASLLIIKKIYILWQADCNSTLGNGFDFKGLLKRAESVISSVSTYSGLVDNCVGLFRTVIGVQVAEVCGLAIEIDDVDQINGVSNDSCGVHEVVSDLRAN